MGAYGRQSDGNVFARCLFGRLLKTNPNVARGLPTFGALSTTSALCVCGWRGVSPTAQLNAPLSWATNFYRSWNLSRLAFKGLSVLWEKLPNQWPPFCGFHRPLIVTPRHAEVVVKAALILHNLLRKEIGVQYINHTTADREDVGGVLHLREWRSEQYGGSNQRSPMVRIGRKNPQEDYITIYLRNASWEVRSVAWQHSALTSTTSVSLTPVTNNFLFRTCGDSCLQT